MAELRHQPLRLAPAPREHPRIEDDSRFAEFLLDVQGHGLDIAPAITGASLELTIEGASVLEVTVDDTDRAIQNSRTLNQWAWGDNDFGEETWVIRGRNVDVRFDGVWYRLVNPRKAGSQLTLTFEDRAVSWLRNRTGPLKATRGDVTRAEFILRMLNKVRTDGGRQAIPWVIPELHKAQPIARYTVSPTQVRTTVEGGDRTGSEYKASAGGASKYDRKYGPNERITFREARMIFESVGMSPRAALQMAYICLGESAGGDPNGIRPGVMNFGGDGGTGMVQITPIAGGWNPSSAEYRLWQSLGSTEGMKNPIRNAKVAKALYDNYGLQPWVRTRYWYQAQAVPKDVKSVGKVSGPPGSTVTTETTSGRVKPYEFTVGRHETFWDAIQRLVQEVRWRAFIRRGTFWLASEPDLFDQEPEIVIVEGEDGVDSIDWDLDLYARNSIGACTVQCRADRWTALPGSVVVIQGEKDPDDPNAPRLPTPVNGRWLVTRVPDTDVFDGAVEISLSKPLPEKPEPAPEVETVTERSSRSIPGVSTGGRDSVGGVRLSDEWGGSKAVFDQFIRPFMRRRGLSVSSAKRSTNNSGFSNPAFSDHHVGCTQCYAEDYPTYSGAPHAQALAEALGIDGPVVGTYRRYPIKVGGRTFLVQILWAVAEHYDHVHVGVRRFGYGGVTG